jgi:hypothetical protein
VSTTSIVKQTSIMGILILGLLMLGGCDGQEAELLANAVELEPDAITLHLAGTPRGIVFGL